MRIGKSFTGVFTVLAALGMSAASFAVDTSSMSTKFSVAQPTAVPSATLVPGSYSIKVVDHLGDRLIVRVENAGSSTHSTFIALVDADLAKSGQSGPILFKTGLNGEAALRGFTFPGGNTLQFVYPKADAVTLAKANSTKIVAIDPASEGRTSDPALSKDDMEVVTLWTLASAPVGPGDAAPAITAERYKEVAIFTPPKPALKQLPHTASDLPLFGLFAFLCLFAAAALRAARDLAKKATLVREH